MGGVHREGPPLEGPGPGAFIEETQGAPRCELAILDPGGRGQPMGLVEEGRELGQQWGAVAPRGSHGARHRAALRPHCPLCPLALLTVLARDRAASVRTSGCCQLALLAVLCHTWLRGILHLLPISPASGPLLASWSLDRTVLAAYARNRAAPVRTSGCSAEQNRAPGSTHPSQPPRMPCATPSPFARDAWNTCAHACAAQGRPVQRRR